MKHLLAIFLFFISIHANSQENPNYDSALANKLEADDFGMKSYAFVLLKTGSNTSEDMELRSKSFMGHMENIIKMVEAKELIVAGPMGENNDAIRGIFILNTSSIDEAREMLQSDPAIAKNYLEAVFYPWYGSAALSTYLPFSDKVWKKQP